MSAAEDRIADVVLWHDIECGAYVADLPLWRELAARAAGPVLDVGAGSGRVALDLARHGHEVVAVDREPALLEALRERAAGLPVETVVADARELALGRRFPLVLVPMQTVQLLGGAAGRVRLLRAAAAHLTAGGTLALALAEVSGWDDTLGLPVPDMRERDGWVYASQPKGVRVADGAHAIERLRQAVAPDGARAEALDVTWLDDLSPVTLEREGVEAGLTIGTRRTIPETSEHVGSDVVVLHGR